jgi:hypothetical protein
VIKTDKPRELSPEAIEQFQAENRARGKVQVLNFPSDETPDRPAKFFIVRPTRQTLTAITETGSKDIGKANDMMINACVLAGDLDQLDLDDALYFGLLTECGRLIDAKKKL